MNVSRHIPGITLFSIAILASSQFAGAGTITLGTAGNYALLTSGGAGGGFAFNGPGIINGNVGVATPGATNFASPAEINGILFLGTGVNTPPGGFTITGGVQQTAAVNTALNQAISDANTAAAAATAAGATPTGTVPGGTVVVTNSSNSVTFTGTAAGQNVLDVASINLNNGTFTIDGNGSGTQTFIVNVTSDFIINGSASILLGPGVTASDVLFNIEGTGSSVSITGSTGTQENGTILAPDRNISIHDQTLNGEVIGAFGMSLNIQDTSGFTLNGPPTTPPFGGPLPGTPLPASVWGGLVLLAGFGAMRIVRRRATL